MRPPPGLSALDKLGTPTSPPSALLQRPRSILEQKCGRSSRSWHSRHSRDGPRHSPSDWPTSKSRRSGKGRANRGRVSCGPSLRLPPAQTREALPSRLTQASDTPSPLGHRQRPQQGRHRCAGLPRSWTHLAFRAPGIMQNVFLPPDNPTGQALSSPSEGRRDGGSERTNSHVTKLGFRPSSAECTPVPGMTKHLGPRDVTPPARVTNSWHSLLPPRCQRARGTSWFTGIMSLVWKHSGKPGSRMARV